MLSAGARPCLRQGRPGGWSEFGLGCTRASGPCGDCAREGRTRSPAGSPRPRLAAAAGTEPGVRVQHRGPCSGEAPNGRCARRQPAGHWRVGHCALAPARGEDYEAAGGLHWAGGTRSCAPIPAEGPAQGRAARAEQHSQEVKRDGPDDADVTRRTALLLAAGAALEGCVSALIQSEDGARGSFQDWPWRRPWTERRRGGGAGGSARSDHSRQVPRHPSPRLPRTSGRSILPRHG